MPSRKLTQIAVFLWLVIGLESAARAYLGPGAGLGAIGVVLGLIGSVFLGLFALIWYPVKRTWKAVVRRRSEPQKSDESDG